MEENKNELERINDVLEYKLSDILQMNTQAIASLNKNLSMIASELKDIKTEQMGIRRNTSYLKNLCEIFNRELKDYAKE